MFYYAEVDSNYCVTQLHALAAESTNDSYIAITEDQYTNGALVGKYYNQLTNTFEVITGVMGSTDNVMFKSTNMMLSTKLDNLTADIAEKADAEHTHANYATTEQVEAAIDEAVGDIAIPAVPVQSVNGKTGAVNLTASDVGALPDTTVIPTIPSSLPANGGNADTVDGKHASEFASATHSHDYAASSHAHAQSDITGLASALAGKAANNHTHSDYVTNEDFSALENTVDGKAASNHTHTQYAAASHTHSQYANATDVSEIETALAGKAAADHTHTQYASTSHSHSNYVTNDTYTAGLATKAASAHTHAQSDISGLASALSGKANTSHTHSDYATVTDLAALEDTVDSKAASNHTHTQYAATSHTHDDRYFTESEVNALLAAKSDASHTHTASAVGAAASNHNHNSAYISKDLLFTNDTGGVEYSYGSGSGKNVLTEISNMPQGFHTIYAIAGTAGNPETAESYRYFIHKTSTTIGWIYAFAADGSVYSNYLAGANTYKGWKTIHDAKRKPLWTGSYYMTAGHTATPSKKLSECEHGWMLLWSDYDPDTSDVNNTDFCTTMIPNRNWAGGTWIGQAYYCDCPRYTAGTATDSESRIIKVLNVYDNKLVGTANNNAAPRNDVILRAVYEF